MKLRKFVASGLVAFVGLAALAPTIASAAPHHRHAKKVCHMDRHHHRVCHWVR